MTGTLAMKRKIWLGTIRGTGHLWRHWTPLEDSSTKPVSALLGRAGRRPTGWTRLFPPHALLLSASKNISGDGLRLVPTSGRETLPGGRHPDVIAPGYFGTVDRDSEDEVLRPASV
jgi:hypothetical protein